MICDGKSGVVVNYSMFIGDWIIDFVLSFLNVVRNEVQQSNVV
jgi:hypothetical protein